MRDAFVVRPNDPPQQRLLDKLVAAQWVARTVLFDKPVPNAGTGQLLWTPLGRQRLGAFLSLIREVEEASLPLTNDELPLLKLFAELASSSAGGESYLH